MKLVIPFLVFTFLGMNIVFGQKYLPVRPFERIVFPDITPKWHINPSDVSFVGDTCDAYNTFYKPFLISDLILVVDDFIYSLYYRILPSTKAGTYIEKRSLMDGSLIWQTYYGWPADEYRDFGRKMFINEKGNLEVTGNISDLPYSYDQPIAHAHFSKREYDVTNGKLLFFDYKSFKDSLALTLFFNPTFHNETFCKEAVGFSLISKYPLPDFKYEYYSFNAMYNSNANEVDSFKLASKLFPSDQAPIQVNDSLFLLVEFDTTKILFRYVDKNLDVVKEIISEGDFNYLILISADVERQVYFFADVRGFFDNNRILCFDGNAKLIKKTNIPTENKNPFEVVDWKEPTRPLFSQPANKYLSSGRGYAVLNLYKGDSKDTMSLIKTFTASDSLRTVDLLQVQYVNNYKDVLVTWRERASYYDVNGNLMLDDAANVYGLLLFDSNTFEKYLTSLSEITSSQFSIYPNPTSDIIHINFQSAVSGMAKLTDINGKAILTQRISYEDSVPLNLRSLLSGIYIVSFSSDDGRTVYPSRKVVKI